MPEDEKTPEQTSDKPVELVPPVEAAAPPTPDPKEKTGTNETNPDIKIVITSEKGITIIGLQKPGCDPLSYEVKDLAGAVKGIPAFLNMAMEKWKKEPHYPATAYVPTTPKTPAPASRPVATTSSAPKKKQEDKQVGMPGV